MFYTWHYISKYYQLNVIKIKPPICKIQNWQVWGNLDFQFWIFTKLVNWCQSAIAFNNWMISVKLRTSPGQNKPNYMVLRVSECFQNMKLLCPLNVYWPCTFMPSSITTHVFQSYFKSSYTTCGAKRKCTTTRSKYGYGCYTNLGEGKCTTPQDQ